MTHDDDTILVLGGTGKTGRPLVRTLREAGRRVRAASRGGGTRFDWFDRSTWAPALEGAAAVYLVAPGDPEPVPDFVQQAEQAGVRRFVVLSGRGIDQLPTTIFRGMAAAERAVRASGARWTILRPNNFDQNFDDPAIWGPQIRAGRLALPTGSVPDPFIDTEDVAEVAAALLTSDGHADSHHGESYDLSGPRPVAFGEAVEILARAAGRPVDFVELTPAEYRAELRGADLPEEFVHELDTLFEGLRTGLHTKPGDGVQRVLGREPRDFESYAARTAAAGAWS
ncbi:NAD(P)H-binding protein [Streptomyces sp. NPDC000594]|uniref:NAD(P)H-binding protein n=1 Tax=Streptomyces sp. NPDC000594 TaxID=3154261 RepID=UPI0033340924